MRRLLTFACEGAELGATLDGADGATGLLLVTGGSQSRIGSHRMYERLASDLAGQGISCLRFDRRGVGDSGGEDPGFLGSGPDLTAAVAALRAECPQVQRLYGLGLCDGATALALFGDEAGLDGLILVNPWLVEAAPGEPAPAAIRQHYRQRLLSFEGWKKLLSGSANYRRIFSGVIKLSKRTPASPLARDVASALSRHQLPAEWILARGDATAIAAENELRSGAFRGLARPARAVESDSHTFARPGDDARLAATVLAALRRLDAGPDQGSRGRARTAA
ncbi:MAG: hydrolase 1, exosortase A system-associated [Allosphingosinicella sp.]